jgi:hypothetical protein
MQLWQCKVCSGFYTGKDIATNSLFQVKGPTNKEIVALCGCFHYVPGSTLHRIIRWRRRVVVFSNYAVVYR